MYDDMGIGIQFLAVVHSISAFSGFPREEKNKMDSFDARTTIRMRENEFRRNVCNGK